MSTFSSKKVYGGEMAHQRGQLDQVLALREGVVFSMWRWTEIDVTLHLDVAASRSEGVANDIPPSAMSILSQRSGHQTWQDAPRIPALPLSEYGMYPAELSA